MRKSVLIAATVTTATLTLATAASAAVTNRTDPALSNVVNTPSGNLTAASATYDLPKVSAACGHDSDLAVAVQVGGGYGAVQAGVSLDSTGHTGTYYQTSDRSGTPSVTSVLLNNGQPQVGDNVRLSVSFTKDHNTATVTWDDVTRHSSATKIITNAAAYYEPGAVLWPVERANVFHPASLDPFVRFSKIHVSGIAYGVNGSAPSIPGVSGRDYYLLNLSGSRGKLVDSAVRAGATSTDVSWKACS